MKVRTWSTPHPLPPPPPPKKPHTHTTIPKKLTRTPQKLTARVHCCRRLSTAGVHHCRRWKLTVPIEWISISLFTKWNNGKSWYVDEVMGQFLPFNLDPALSLFLNCLSHFVTFFEGKWSELKYDCHKSSTPHFFRISSFSSVLFSWHH